jgi:hypothetical protein
MHSISTKTLVSLFFSVAFPAFVFGQFTGTVNYKSWSTEEKSGDTVVTYNTVKFSPNRVLLTHSMPMQMLFCFDENLVRTLDTVRGVNHTLPNLSAPKKIPTVVDTSTIMGMICYHYRVTNSQQFQGQSSEEITDFWVTPFVRTHYEGLTGYYNQFLNGTGYLLVKMRKQQEIVGFKTTIWETHFVSLHNQLLADSDLALKDKVGL